MVLSSGMSEARSILRTTRGRRNKEHGFQAPFSLALLALCFFSYLHVSSSLAGFRPVALASLCSYALVHPLCNPLLVHHCPQVQIQSPGMSAFPLVLRLHFLPCCLFQRNSKQLVLLKHAPFCLSIFCCLLPEMPSLSGSLGQFPFFLQSLVVCHLFREVFPDAPHAAISAHSHLSV